MTVREEQICAGPLRRLGAMLYDTLLVIAVLMIATLPFLPLANGRVLTPREVGALAYLYWAWELAVVAAYFGFFWTRKGRTLGMQAWRLRIERFDSILPTWGDAMLRLSSACLPWLPGFAIMTIAEHVATREPLMQIGVGALSLGLLNYFIAYFDTERRALHDRWLQTRIVRR